MKKSQFFYLVIAFYGLVVGFLPLVISTIDHFDILAIIRTAEKSFIELFSVWKVDPTINIAIFKPVWSLLLKTTYVLFGLNFLGFRILKSLTLVFFGLSSYLLLCEFSLKNRLMPFITALLAMTAYPVINSTWVICQGDLLSAAFYFLTLKYFLQLKNNSFPLKDLVMCIFWAFLSIFSKENIRVILPVSLFLILIYKNLSKRHIFAFILVSIFCLLATLPMISANIRPTKLPLYHQRVLFLFFNQLSQILVSIGISGTALLLIASLNSYFKFKEKYLLLTAISIILLSFSTPVIDFFSFYASVIFAKNSYLIYIFDILLLLILCIKLFKAKYPLNLMACHTLVIFLFIFSITTLSPHSREEVSTRILIPVLPFLLFLIISAVFELSQSILSKEKLIYKSALAIFLFLNLSAFIYYFLGNLYNEAMHYRLYSKLETGGKTFLSEKDLKRSVIFSLVGPSPIDEVDMKALKAVNQNLTKTSFNILRPYPEKDLSVRQSILSMLAVHEKYNELKKPYPIFVYIIQERAKIPEKLMSCFKKDFSWTRYHSNVLFDEKKSRAGASAWSNSLAYYSKEMAYDSTTPVESYCQEHGKLIYQQSLEYYKLPWLLEELTYRLYKKIPLRLKYEVYTAVYQLDLNNL